MLLKIGSKGEDVKKLQSKLGLSPDGVFGSGTEAKVKEWQKTNGLGVDGIVGPGTWNKMFVTSDPVSESSKVQATTGSQSSSTFKLEKLKGHIPDSVIAQIPDTAAKFGITTPLRLAHLLAQASHESGHFKSVVENLNYSAEGLKKIFPKYFPGSLNESYARKPEKIANRVYSSRMGNGDEASGDGFLFRGRGFLQTTGKSNYAEFNKIVEEDILANPDLVSTKYALASAAFFFQKNNLWSICDRGASDEIVTLVSKRVNGGTIGLSERLSEFKKFHALLN
jgi:putative chitinase